MASGAHAALLNLQKESPDLYAGALDITYDHSSDSFSAVGATMNYQKTSGGPQETVGGFRPYFLTATINDSGVATSASVSIMGTLASIPAPSGTLLTGDLAPGPFNFGFEDGGGDIFEFVFVVTGGDLASDFGGIGAKFGAIVTAWFSNGTMPFDGTWASSFDNRDHSNIDGPEGTGIGDVDNFAIPEPASVLLLAGALAGVARRRRRGAR